MFFDEDPLDRVCRLIVVFLFCVEQVLEVTTMWALRFVWYRLLILKIVIVGRLRIAGRRLGFLFTALYWRHLRVWLVLAGLKPRLTWADVEAHWLQLSARSGIDLPRPPELEAGLQQEQARQTS
jgi:hypothetical protein